MLVAKRSRSIKDEKSMTIISYSNLQKLIGDITPFLNSEMITTLKEVVDSENPKSIAEMIYPISLFEGCFINIVQYNMFFRTIKFAKEFLGPKEEKYTMKLSGNKNITVIAIFYKDIQVLECEFKEARKNTLIGDKPIEIVLQKNDKSYQEILDELSTEITDLNGTYEILSKSQEIFSRGNMENPDGVKFKMLSEKMRRIQTNQSKLLKIGEKGIKDINSFQKAYRKKILADFKGCKWYKITTKSFNEI